MTIRELKNNIANKTFEKIYLFCGEETFLIRQYLDSVKSSALTGTCTELNIFEFNEETDINIIKDAIAQYPQISDKKIVIIKDSGLIKSVSKPAEELLKTVPDDTIVIFVEDDIKKISKPLIKIIETEGAVIEFTRQSKRDLCKWTSRLLSDNNTTMSEDLIEFLVTVCDNNMELIYQEVQKLISGTNNQIIDKMLVHSLIKIPLEYKIFDMIDKLLSNDADSCYKLLSEFKQNKEEPTVIISLIFAQIYSLAQIRDLIEEKYPKIDEFLPANRKWMAKKMASLAPRYTKAELDHIMELCLKYDYAIKTGEMEGFVALEIIIATLLKSS